MPGTDLISEPILVYLDLARTARVEDTHMTVDHYWMHHLEEMWTWSVQPLPDPV